MTELQMATGIHSGLAPAIGRLIESSHRPAEARDEVLRVSGEDAHYFIIGRIRELQRRLPAGWAPRRILDFGCGAGHAAWCLAGAFPGADVEGFDASLSALAQMVYGSSRISFRLAQALSQSEPFDLCYTSAALHHLPPRERLAALQTIYNVMAPGGYVALFEHNPGTRRPAWSCVELLPAGMQFCSRGGRPAVCCLAPGFNNAAPPDFFSIFRGRSQSSAPGSRGSRECHSGLSMQSWPPGPRGGP